MTTFRTGVSLAPLRVMVIVWAVLSATPSVALTSKVAVAVVLSASMAESLATNL